MRVTITHSAIVVATAIVGLTGCKMGPSSGSGWNWFGSKSKPAASSALANVPTGPQLPSAGATPGSAPASAYGQTAAPASPYGASPAGYGTPATPYAGAAGSG